MKVDEFTAQGPVDEAEAATQGPEPAPTRVAAKARLLVTSRWKGILLTVLLAAATAIATVLYFDTFRPGQRTGAAAEQVAIDAASSATVALLSYSPDTLDRDMERAQSLMSGEFHTYYGKFTTDVVAPAVRERGIKASAQVMNSAVMEMQPDAAKILVFLNQETVSRERPEPSLIASSVVVSLTKIDGKWLISALDPV